MSSVPKDCDASVLSHWMSIQAWMLTITVVSWCIHKLYHGLKKQSDVIHKDRCFTDLIWVFSLLQIACPYYLHYKLS